MSAESFNPRDESAIRGQDVLMKHRQQAQNEEKHIHKKYLQGSESGICAQLSSPLMLRATAPPRGPTETLTMFVLLSCVCAGKNRKQNLDL